MNRNIVFVVFGITGTLHANHQEWMVGGYLDEEKAKFRIWELENVMKELGVDELDNKNNLKRIDFISRMKSHEKGDQLFSILNGGVTYQIKVLDIIDGTL